MKQNKQYAEMQVAPGVYVPEPQMTYPEDDPYLHLVNAPQDRELAIDENYPYLDDSFLGNFNRRWGYVLILKLCLGIHLRLKMGLRIRGREILKEYKDQLKGGAITIANHMFRLDCPCVLIAVHAKYTTKIPMFAPNFRTKDNFFMRLVGGIPIPQPEAGMSAMKRFNEAFDEFHRRGWWFHIFPESCRWDMYKPLRPFQKGAFTMSYRYNMPLLPCVITYRERTGIYRLFAPKELPLLTVTIGKPILPNTNNPRKEEVEHLRETAHAQMEQMAGITKNPWPTTWGNM